MQNLDQQLLDEVPDHILQSVTQAIISAYQEAHLWCKGKFHIKPHARQLLPFVRTKLIDLRVHDVCSAHLETTTLSNDVNNWSFTAVRTQNFLLTVARTDNLNGSPRPSKYRKRLAQKNNPFMQDMFQEQLDQALLDQLPDGEKYAVIVHKPSSGDPSIPEFINIVFPTADYQSAIGSGINLLEIFSIAPEVVEAPVEHEEITDDLDGFLKESLEQLKIKQANNEDDEP